MTTWQLGAVASVVIGVAYLSIAGVIYRGLWLTGQLKTNPLAFMTGVIFFSCGVGHGLHAYHLIVPMDTMPGMGVSGGMRSVWTVELAVWDSLTACVAIIYLALRRRYGQLLNTPQMFRDEVGRATSRELQDVLRQLREGVLVLDREGGVEHVNETARVLLERFGLDPERMTAGAAGAPLVACTRATGAAVDDAEIVVGSGVLRVSVRALDVEEPAPHRILVSFADITDQHEAREALHASELRHRTIVEALHEGVVLQQVDGQITACNPQAEVLLGLTRDQMLGRTSLDPRWRAVHEDGSPWPGDEHPVPRALASGVSVGPEVMGVHTPDGRLRWLSVTATPLMEDGRVTAAVASFVDVTARKAIEAELVASSTRTAATLDGLTEGVVLYDADMVRRGINPAGRAMLGVVDDDMLDGEVASTPLEAFDAAGEPLGFEQWPSVVAHRTGAAVTDRVIGFRRTGEPLRWVSVNAAPVRDAEALEEGPWPVVASFTDITERVQRERALVEAEQRVRSTFDAAPVGMRVAALDGTYLEVNKAFADLLGMAVEDLVGRASADVTHPDDLPDQLEGERRLVAGEIPSFQMEKRFLHAAGHVVWTQTDVTVLRDADGNATSTVGQIQDISDRRRHDDQLRHLADHDALTGLLNRRGFQRELERHVAQGERYGSTGALLMLDLDHFKYVNDTLGHKAGDELIVAVADLLRSRLRKTDVIARLGGDEFAVLLPRGTREQARGAADSVLRSLRERQGHLPTLGRLKLSASVGIATLEDPTLTADELLVNADLAMYDAKEAGRDQAADYASGRYHQPRIKARITWMERINAALEHDRFALLAQPILELQTDHVAMHELLLRMKGEGGDLIPPATFLYIAERFELVQEIDRWVLDQACGLLQQQAATGVPTALSVNVSGKSINDPDALLTHIAAALDRTGIDPASLIVELTETAAVSQIHHARTFARDLRHLGCRLAIDDFGAGFGSFYYLKHLPFDFLKIDGEFVTHARHSKPDALIVAALRDMAHGLGREVIAEYCADPETLAYLRAEGIDLAQGFHLGRPVPVEEALQPVA